MCGCWVATYAVSRTSPVGPRVGQDRVALDGGGGEPLVLDPGPDHHVGAGQHVAGAVRVDRPHRLHDVGAHGGELQRRAGRDRLLHVHDHVEEVVVDVDQLGRVDGLGPGLGDDQRDRVADEAHHAVGQRPVLHQVVDLGERRHRVGAQRGGGVHGEHPGRALGVGGVEMGDRGVGQGAPHEDGVGGAGDPEVVDVGAPTGDEVRVLDPADAVPEDRSDHEPEAIPG